MSSIYTSLELSPRKKRCPPSGDDKTLTPKKLRTAPPTPPPTVSRHSGKTSKLPDHLVRLHRIHSDLQHAMSHALATCAVSPDSDTGLLRNVLNHLSLSTYTGLTTHFDVDDIRKLCWVWEWDAQPVPSKDQSDKIDDEENPFLITSTSSSTSVSSEWTRGGMGFILSSTTHYSKQSGKRVPAYGIGIEVEMDIDKDMGGGMAAVARWTAAAETRRSEFQAKLKRWVELCPNTTEVPQIPLAAIPELAMPAKISSLTRTLASVSPKGTILPTLSLAPSSPSKSPTKSPSKRALRDFAIPFSIPSTASKSPVKASSVPFPQTPSRRDKTTDLFSPSKPVASKAPGFPTEPSTPVRQRGANAITVPPTPTSSRRQALYERVRQKSLTASPTKALSSEVKGGKLTRDQMLKMGQEEMRRRCLLGRLGGVAESVWMLFSTPVAGQSTAPAVRKRRTLPTTEVATAVIKSSPVPISTAEARESLCMLAKLCPFFLKELNIAGEEWLEMPAANSVAPVSSDDSPTKKLPTPPSPGPTIKGKHESAEELVNRSPRRVKRETGGLREVREIIRKELELQD